MQASTWWSDGNRRFTSTVLVVKLLLFARRSTSTRDDEKWVIAFPQVIDPSGPRNQLRVQRPEAGHYGKFNSLESAVLSRQKIVPFKSTLSTTVPYSRPVPGPKTASPFNAVW